jgi:hypothetical protein
MEIQMIDSVEQVILAEGFEDYYTETKFQQELRSSKYMEIEIRDREEALKA